MCTYVSRPKLGFWEVHILRGGWDFEVKPESEGVASVKCFVLRGKHFAGAFGDMSSQALQTCCFVSMTEQRDKP